MIGTVAMPTSACGTAVAHHGEILQGAFTEGDRTVRALVTMPWPSGHAVARFERTGEPEITVEPAHKKKAAYAASLTLSCLDAPCGGRLSIASDIPEQLGLGSSTADVVAAIRAAAEAYDTDIDPAV